MAVSSTPPMNGEELQAAGRSPAVQLTIVGTRPEAKSLFQFCQVFFEGGRAALVGVVCVVVTGMGLTKSSACIKYFACDEPVYRMHPTWLGVLRREGDWASGALPQGLEGFESPVALGITAPSQCVPPLWFSFWSKLELN